MPRLSIKDARAAAAAIEYALATLPQDVPQRADWERVHHRLHLRLDIGRLEHSRERRGHVNSSMTKRHASRDHKST